MKKTLFPSVSVVASLASVFFALFLTVGCQKTAQDDRQSAEANAAFEIPALYERRGELAKAEEWQRTKEKVTELKERLKINPSDVKARLQVATIYLSEARITGEHPYYYPAILKILDGVLAMDAKNFEATTFKSSVKMSQHQFAEALELAQKARTINPQNAYVYGVLVDANVELGHYEAAVAMSDTMQALKPSLESYARASYLREIYGDYKGAIEAMKMAVQAGLPGSEPHCWVKNTLGHLYETTGKLDEAERQYTEILTLRPSYAFAAGGLARVQKDRKQYDKALATLNQAAEIMPEFSFHEQMAEIYALQGQKEKAKTKYAEVVTMLQEDAESGHAVDLELCKLYIAAEQWDLALEYGLKEFQKRPKNMDVNHALAWVYFKQKNLKKAQEHITTALKTGSKDPELLQKASAIALSTGNTIESNRLASIAKKINPQFTL